jgi:1-acyl-sn-glycerol-3-phosphate acyltransferase
LQTVVRSLLFNAAFDLVSTVLLVFGVVPFLLMGQRTAMNYARFWARLCVSLLRVVAGVRLEVRGQEHIPSGGAIVASKHQSALETFALLPLLPFPTFVVKRELKWVPLFGLYTSTSGMIHVDRGGGAAALKSLVERSREEVAKARQIIIFPEGTRMAPGAPPDYHYGVVRLYRSLDVPVVPVALNCGLFWPRRSFLRHPGTAVIEFLPPIPPDLDAKAFAAELQETVEAASDRLLAEAAYQAGPPPLPEAARARLALLQQKSALVPPESSGLGEGRT